MQISSEFLAMPAFHTNVLIHVNFMMFVSSGGRCGADLLSVSHFTHSLTQSLIAVPNSLCSALLCFALH
jgi:hypothetical protein